MGSSEVPTRQEPAGTGDHWVPPLAQLAEHTYSDLMQQQRQRRRESADHRMAHHLPQTARQCQWGPPHVKRRLTYCLAPAPCIRDPMLRVQAVKPDSAKHAARRFRKSELCRQTWGGGANSHSVCPSCWIERQYLGHLQSWATRTPHYVPVC
jgi:hypothetical protein